MFHVDDWTIVYMFGHFPAGCTAPSLGRQTRSGLWVVIPQRVFLTVLPSSTYLDGGRFTSTSGFCRLGTSYLMGVSVIAFPCCWDVRRANMATMSRKVGGLTKVRTLSASCVKGCLCLGPLGCGCGTSTRVYLSALSHAVKRVLATKFVRNWGEASLVDVRRLVKEAAKEYFSRSLARDTLLAFLECKVDARGTGQKSLAFPLSVQDVDSWTDMQVHASRHREQYGVHCLFSIPPVRSAYRCRCECQVGSRHSLVSAL